MIAERANPTESIDLDFTRYAAQRRQTTEAHMEGGLPDYAYGQDYALRQKLRAVPGLYAFCKALTNAVVPYQKQEANLQWLKVGPNQFPEVYEIAAECARRLGIGIPTLFIKPDLKELNAYTLACEDDAPMVVIHSSLLERFTPGELKCIIGHECGHIHNNHSIYNTAVQLLLGAAEMGILSIPGLQQLFALASTPIRWALLSWSRACEVTSDRAAVICGDGIDDAVSVEAKFMYGAAFDRTKIDVESILKQYDTLRATPVRFLELERTHPLPVRRIFAQKEFMNSEVLYRWRPEWKNPGMKLVDKQELNLRCEKYIGVVKSEKRSRGT